MKKIISVTFLFFSISSFSQTIGSLQTSIKKLYQANYLMDFALIVSNSYPEMVEKTGHDLFLEKVEKHYENEEFRLRLQLETVPFLLGQIKKIEGKSFCVITCRNPLRYTFETKLTSETATSKADWIKQIDKTNDVTFEPKRNSFNVRKTTTFIAVADETTNNQWKFFNFDDAIQYESFQSVFGENIQKELGL